MELGSSGSGFAGSDGPQIVYLVSIDTIEANENIFFNRFFMKKSCFFMKKDDGIG